MATWLAKEAREMVRLGRWIPLVAVYLFLGISQPIMSKLLPVILSSSASNLPKGTVFNIPPSTVDQVLNGIIVQYNGLGIITLILVGMGLIAGERKLVGEWLWSKPVNITHYVLAKFSVFFLVAALSSLIGLGLGAYYTAQLIGPVNWNALCQGALLFVLYQAFLISVILLASALVTSPSLAGGVALIIIVLVNVLLPLVWQGHFISGLQELIQATFSQTVWSRSTPVWEPIVTTLMGTALLIGLQIPLLAWRKTSH
jgi:ABC-2 type transport system permease protein